MTISRWILAAAFSTLILFSTSVSTQAQDVGGGDGGGQVGDGGTVGGGANQTGGQTATLRGNDGIVGDERNVEIEISDDVRNQGFVGATATSILNGRTSSDAHALERNPGFVGSASDSSGPPLTDGANFGGGNVNQGSTFGGGGGQGGGRGGFGGATQGQVIVPRRSVRAQLRPSFYSPRPTSQVVSQRFNNHFLRQPGTQNLNGRYTITIQNRTATINGSVPNRFENERLMRQLRLQPGVYNIQNNLQVLN